MKYFSIIILIFGMQYYNCLAVLVETVDSLNLTQYEGTWYQMYTDLTVLRSYQDRALCVKVQYKTRSNNTLEFCESFRRYSPYGALTKLVGNITQPNFQTPGQLKRKLNTMPYATPYLVIKLGPVDAWTNQYQYSIVTDQNEGTLFVYARDIHEFKKHYQSEILDFCSKNGFNRYYNEPRETPQSPPCFQHDEIDNWGVNDIKVDIL